MSQIQTEFAFTLPRGLLEETGKLHREGVMRLARAFDEVEPLEDGRTRTNEAYLSILLLSRVIVRLGSISPVPPEVIEQLFASDFAYLQEIYVRLNEDRNRMIETRCPSCGKRFGLDLVADVGSAGNPGVIQWGTV
jgi:hypothetical protein